MTGRDGVRVARVRDAIVVMVELYPTAYIIVLDDKQAVDMAQHLLECAMRPVSAGDDDSALEGLLKGMAKKPKGEAS